MNLRRPLFIATLPATAPPLSALLPTRSRSRAWLLAVLAVSVVLGITEWSHGRSTQAVAAAQERSQAASHAYGLLRSAAIADAQLRGFLLSGSLDRFAAHHQAVHDAQQQLAWLQQRHADDAPAAALLRGLRVVSSAPLQPDRAAVAALTDSGDVAARSAWLAMADQPAIAAVQRAAQALVDLEAVREVHLRNETADTLQASRLAVGGLAGGSVLALLLFLRQRSAVDGERQGHALALQAERARLEAEVAARTLDLTALAAHLQTVREEECARLARDLHDELGAVLVAVKLDTARLRRMLGTPSADVDARLRHLGAAIDTATALKRRILEDLRPTALDTLGLPTALEILGNAFADRSEIAVDARLAPVSLSPAAQTTAYRLVQEALTNIAKYAAATEVTITLQAVGERVVLSVQDNGRGFDVQASRGSAHGLLGMRYRVQSEGGTLLVASTPGQGTRIEATLPAA